MAKMLQVHNEEETRALAARVAAITPKGMTLLLDGDLGAGKTTFVQGFVTGLKQLEPVRVKSPTYALCHAYKTEPRLWHADLYRLSGGAEAETLGVLEGAGPDDIVIVEWAERAPGLVEDALHVRIELMGEEGRRFTFTASGPRSTSLLEKIQ